MFNFGFFGMFGIGRLNGCLVVDFLEFLEFLELGDSEFSFGCFAIVKCCCILWNLCWLKRFESTRHLHNFQNNSKSATLTPLGFGILGMWICEILLCALESVSFKET